MSQLFSNGSFLILSAWIEGESDQFLYRSTDYGDSWVRINPGLAVSSYYDLLLVGNSLLATAYSSNGDSALAMVSADEGLTWEVSPNPPIRSDPSGIWTDGKSLFGRSPGSAVVVAGIGEPWRSWGDGLPPTPFGWMPLQKLVFSDSLAFALLFLPEPLSLEMWRRPLSELVAGADPLDRSVNPTEFHLLQNYPNPFNPSTNIRYGLPSRSHVTLSVFNTLGQQVATLVEGEQEAGYHEAQFDDPGLASGVYLYRLKSRLWTPPSGGFQERSGGVHTDAHNAASEVGGSSFSACPAPDRHVEAGASGSRSRVDRRLPRRAQTPRRTAAR